VSPVVECIVATPLCPHALSVRPLVLSAAETVSVKVLSPTSELVLTVDGQDVAKLTSDDRVVVSRATRPLRLVRFTGQTFFSTLRHELRWASAQYRASTFNASSGIQ
jgi:NAD+ kinase